MNAAAPEWVLKQGKLCTYIFGPFNVKLVFCWLGHLKMSF